MVRKKRDVPFVTTKLRTDIIRVPEVISQASGIVINGRKIKSVLYTTDIAIIVNNDADAILAVYPFTPNPGIIEAITAVAPVPVISGIGGGITEGRRSANIGLFAESLGSTAVVVNAPTSVETISYIEDIVDIPIIYTIVSEYAMIQERLDAGVDIINVSGGARTTEIVRKIRKDYPDLPIMATGGKTDEQILETIQAGANIISYSPPTTHNMFKEKMNSYREEIYDRVDY